MDRLVVVGLVLVFGATSARGADSRGWRYYCAGDAGGTRYSSLAQIERGNVETLKIAWIWRGNDVSNGAHTSKKTGFE